MSSPRSIGWPEKIVLALVVLVLIVVVVGAFSASNDIPSRAYRVATNLKQLHLATQMMALDGAETTNRDLGWPGDTGGTFTNWTTQLIKGKYLSVEELCELLSTRDHRVEKLPITNDTGVYVYAVREESDGDAVFLSSANFLYTPKIQVLSDKPNPFGGKEFIVLLKHGGGKFLEPKFAAATNHIGIPLPLLR